MSRNNLVEFVRKQQTKTEKAMRQYGKNHPEEQKRIQRTLQSKQLGNMQVKQLFYATHGKADAENAKITFDNIYKRVKDRQRMLPHTKWRDFNARFGAKYAPAIRVPKKKK